ncbi:MAG TPA: DsbA family protein [Longimicrobiales bacterium]
MMERIKRVVDTVGTAVLVVCAIVVTGLVVRRELGGRGAGSPVVAVVEDWERLASGGHRIGSPDAELRIIEFSDFQCPYCRRAAATLDSVRRELGDRVAVIYRHFPLESIHPHAMEAALAAECAADQGAFTRLHDVLFQYQDSIGTMSWTRFAELARVPDPTQFSMCVRGGEHERRVRDDIAAAHRIGVQGTPTFVLNGMVLRGVLSAAEWKAVLDEADR